MPDFNDSWIDEQLRNVPLPDELLPRLREISALGDREIDHLLREVAMPAALADRLHAIGSLTDTDLDDEARHVPLPRAAVPRLRQSIRREVRYSQLGRLAIAASLLLAIGGGGWLIVSGLKPGGDPAAARRHVPSNIADGANETASKAPPKLAAPPAAETKVVQTPDARPVEQPTPLPVLPATKAIAGSPNVSPTPPENDESVATENPPVLEQPFQAAEVLGNSSLATQPDLRVARAIPRQGVAGPRIKGYDLLFELNKGEHPPVHPGKAAALGESRPPIWTDTSSYEWARRAVSVRQPLPAGQIHAEDFLAAMDYGFPPPSGSALGIRTAGGPSPLASPAASMIQIAVQAGRFDRARDSGAHLTLAIDASAAVAGAERWAAVRRALADLVDQLSPRDRVSIVVFCQRPTVLARRANRDELKAVLPGLEAIEPRGLSDLTALLAAADSIARQALPDGQVRRESDARLVLMTDGVGWIDPTALPRAKELLARTAAAGIAVRVVDVRPDEVASPQLEELARAGARTGAADVRHAPTRRAIARELREALLGHRDVVASGVTMKIKFNPEAVESYRLIGHDPTAAGGLMSASLEADLRSGETATALYEVELKPEGPDAVATVEVSWHEPGTEEVRHVQQTIGRLQFAPSWMESPLSLQLATLVAETAAILRGSSFAPAGPRPLDQVADLADRANPLLQSRESFQDLKSLLDRARAARPQGR